MGGDADVTDGPVGCTPGAGGLHLGSFCAALSGCAMLLKRISSLTDVDLGACSTEDPVHNTRSLLWWPGVFDSDQCLAQSAMWPEAGSDP